MAVPQTPPLSAAGTALGLGDLLAQQIADESDELRKRRLAQAQFAGISPAAVGTRAALASPMGGFFGIGGLR